MMNLISGESFLGTSNVGKPYGESDFLMYPFFSFSCINLSSDSSSLGPLRYGLKLNVRGASSVNLILWSQSLLGGIFWASSSEKTCSNSLNCSGSVIFV